MALLVEVTITKPSADTPTFGKLTDPDVVALCEKIKVVKDRYRKSGQLMSEKYDETADGLTIQYASLWKSTADYDDYLYNNMDEVKASWEARKAYNLKVGITEIKKTTKV